MVPFDANAEKGLLGCCVLGAFDEVMAAGVDENWLNWHTRQLGTSSAEWQSRAR